ncbi:hypothetical protein GGR51DRAFT_532547 [Nemania sp. FL0031]|nr:hypothetical protein GGR51DRAFT_532547 [Nemania sp. FL0031]
MQHHREHRCPVSGYITMGDIPGSWNDVVGGLDGHSLFGNKTEGSHAASIKQTSHSLKHVLKTGRTPYVFTSPRRPNLSTYLVNVWRKQMWSTVIPLPPVPWNSRPGLVKGLPTSCIYPSHLSRTYSILDSFLRALVLYEEDLRAIFLI